MTAPSIPRPVQRDPIDVLTDGLSEDTALRVRQAITRAVRFGQMRDFYQAEWKALAEIMKGKTHKHLPGASDSACGLCEAEVEEQRILGQAESCTAQLGGRR